VVFIFFFFFQAEDGIRDRNVTGVQTCALPICFKDEQWQGFTGDVDVTLDMGRRERLNRVSMRFMQLPDPGIYFPQEFKVFFSDNGKDFKEIGSMRNDLESVDKKLSFKTFLVEMDKPQVARYIKVVATNVKGGHLFTDELVVY